VVNEPKQENKTAWWAPALEIFTEVSSWIAGPIIIALIAGKALDNHYDTKPWFFIGLTAVAFMVSCYGIFRVVIRYMSRLEVEDPRQKPGKKITENGDKKEN